MKKNPKKKIVNNPENNFKLNKQLKITLVLILILVSIAFRMVNIDSPLLERHAFRQTQTAITVQNYLTDGASIFNYQTPVFGPPWTLPFEFPVYQLTVYTFVKLGIENIDTAARLTTIFYFYLSAWLLFLVCKFFFSNNKIPTAIILVYIFSPFTIVWSRTSLIDYASVTFALGYLYFFLSWLENRNKYHLLLALGFGSLGYLTKVTSMLPVVIILAFFILKRVIELIKAKNIAKESWFLIFLLCLIIIPLVIGVLWIRYTDQVKNGSAYTAWLNSENLSAWNYGTWSDKLSPAKWGVIVKRIFETFMPYFNLIFLPIGLWFILKYKRSNIHFVYLSFIAALLTIFVFFNLYFTHDYYLIAVSPFLAIPIGFGLYHLLELLAKKTIWLIPVILLLSIFSLYSARDYVLPSYQVSYDNQPIVLLGNYIKNVTSEGEYAIVTDFDWDPSILYYSGRKGFMLRDFEGAESNQLFKKHNFSIVITPKEENHPTLFANWKSKTQIGDEFGLKIFRVTDLEV